MEMISPGWQCNLSTLLVEGGGNVSRSVATAAMFWHALAQAGHWPPSWLVVGATSLARARVAVRSTVRILSASGVGLCHGGLH
jgi:hypothetical protein